MNPDPSVCLSDTGTNLDELDPQGVDLGALEFCPFQMPSHQDKQTVRKDMEIETELIGKEPMTTQPIGLELELQLLYPVLDIPPKDIDLIIDPLGVETQVRHHEPLIGTLVGVLGLDNHSAPSHPRVRPIAEGPKEPLLGPGFTEPILGTGQKTGSLFPQPVIGDEPDHIMDVLLLTEPVKRRHGKPSIGSQDNLSSPVDTLEPLDDPLEHGHRTMGGMGVSRPKHTGHGKTRQAIKDQKGMVHVLVIIAMKEAQLLMPVGGIIGRIDVKNDHISRTRMGLKIQRKEPVTETPQVPPSDPVFKTTKRGLGGKIPRCLRKSSRRNLQSRITAKGRRIVGVLIAHGNGEDPLPQQGPQLMNDSTRIPRVIQRLGHGLGQPMTLVKLSEKQTAGVGGDPATLKISDDFFSKKTSKMELFVADCIHRASSLRYSFGNEYNILADARCFLNPF